MNRNAPASRMFVTHHATVLIALLSAGCLFPGRAAARQPNVVLILADDLGFNLRDDPGETMDLGEAFPDRITALRSPAETVIAGLKADPVLPLSMPQKE